MTFTLCYPKCGTSRGSKFHVCLVATLVLLFIHELLLQPSWSSVAGIKSGGSVQTRPAASLPLTQFFLRSSLADITAGIQQSYVVTSAIYSPHDQKLKILGSKNKTWQLPVRGGFLVVEETTAADPCSEHVDAGMYHLEHDGGLPWNFWHWTIDNLLLAFHSVIQEILVGNSIVFFSTYPHRLRDTNKLLALFPQEVDHTNAVSIWDLLPEYAREQLLILFRSKDRVLYLGPNYYADPNGDLRIAKPAGLQTPNYSVCIQRLYIGARTVCSVTDRPATLKSQADVGECQFLLTGWRTIIWSYFSITPSGVNSKHPIVSFVVRPDARHKRMINLEHISSATSRALLHRFGTEGYEFSSMSCDGMKNTAENFARSSMIIMARGACQANIPLVQNGAGVLYIATCPGDQPGLPVMPAGIHIVVHELQSYLPGDCNAIDFEVDAATWLKDFDSLLAMVHPAAVIAPRE